MAPLPRAWHCNAVATSLIIIIINVVIPGCLERTAMFRSFTKGRRTIIKWILAAGLFVMAFSMVISLAPLGGGDTTQMQANVLASVDGANITTQDLRQGIDSRLRNTPLAYQSQLVPRLAQGVL